MFEELDSIEWGALQHAYGDAWDTPHHLRRLLSPSWATRRRALRALSHSVYHQSGGYSASPPAMRFLLEALAAPEVGQKALILSLIVELGLAMGPYHSLASGRIDPRPWLERWYGRDDSTNLGCFLSCESLYVEQAELFASFLEPRWPAALRAEAAFALAWVPGAASWTLPRLQAAWAQERRLRVRVSILCAVGVLSVGRSASERASLRGWVEGLRVRRPELAAAQTLAEVWLADEAPGPALQARLAEVALSGLDLYPSPWRSGALDELAVALVQGRAEALGWALGPWWVALLERACARFEAASEEEEIEIVHTIAATAIRQCLREPVAEASALVGEGRAVVERVVLTPRLFQTPGRGIEGALEQAGLPSRLVDLVRWLGWLPADDEDRPRWTIAVHLHGSGVEVPEALGASTGLEPRAMLARFHPWDAALLEEVAAEVDWERVSRNVNVAFDDALLERFASRWSWWELARNPAVTWDEARIARFAERLSWRGLSARVDLPWSEALLEQYRERWDWNDLSSNTGLPWSEALIERYEAEWTWHLLSQNPALPWSRALLRRYRRWYWNYLSNNDGLPWSMEFLKANLHRIDPCQLCKVERFPWTEAFLEERQGWLTCWGNLSANRGLPWSDALIKRYADRWNWYLLSKNPALPWSRALLERFQSQWQYGDLIFNPALPWDDPAVVELFAAHASSVSVWFFRYHAPCIPWDAALIADPRLSHLISEDDRGLYERFFAGQMTSARVAAIFEQGRALEAALRASRRAALQASGPPLPEGHPLWGALGLA